VRQVAAAQRLAGSEIVRITVDRDEAAAAVPHIKERLLRMGVTAPIVGDFHYLGHKTARRSSGVRAGPRQVPPSTPATSASRKQARPPVLGDRRDGDQAQQDGAYRRQLGFARPGAAHPPDGENARSAAPIDARAVTREAMVQSALLSAERAEEIGLPRPARIILSATVSAVQDLIAVYIDLARRSDYALHLG